MAFQWYVVKTAFQQERRASKLLSDQGFQTFLPLARVESRTRGGLLVAKTRPLFQTYLFVRFNVKELTWHAILGTTGVKTFVGTTPGAAEPNYVPAQHMKELRQRLQEAGGIFQLNLSRPKYIAPNTLVQILFGPYRDQTVPVQADLGSRVEVLLRFANGTIPVKLDRECLAVAS